MGAAYNTVNAKLVQGAAGAALATYAATTVTSATADSEVWENDSHGYTVKFKACDTLDKCFSSGTKQTFEDEAQIQNPFFPSSLSDVSQTWLKK